MAAPRHGQNPASSTSAAKALLKVLAREAFSAAPSEGARPDLRVGATESGVSRDSNQLECRLIDPNDKGSSP